MKSWFGLVWAFISKLLFVSFMVDSFSYEAGYNFSIGPNQDLCIVL